MEKKSWKLLHRNALRRAHLRLAAWQRALLCWVVLVPLLFVAMCYFKHPSFYFLRGQETAALLIAAAIGAWLAWRTLCGASSLGRTWEPGLRLAGFLLLFGLVVVQEGQFRWQQYQVMQANAATRLVGQHFVVGFQSFDEVKPLAERGLIGGIYITRRNLKGETAASLRQRIDELQVLRQRAGLPPLFVMADQEGGDVSHLSPMLARRPALATLVSERQEDLEARAYAYGEQQGRELAALGINMNLSPVVDLKSDRKRDWIDLHTQISRRAIDADPWVVTQVASAYGAGLLASGIQPTVKHFPGLARVRGDTHLVKASLNDDPVERAADWLPFREVTARTGAAMMLGHVHLPDIDPQRPASISRALVQGVLRSEEAGGWNYQGLLITDDLNMGGVYGDGIGRAATLALDAGVDLVLVSYDPEQYYRALYAATEAWRAGGIGTEREMASAKRLATHWKRRGGNLPPAVLASRPPPSIEPHGRQVAAPTL